MGPYIGVMVDDKNSVADEATLGMLSVVGDLRRWRELNGEVK